MARIERILIDGFRGASRPFELTFADKKLVVIFGENGTGKTTIVDALDAVGNRSGGSLATKSSTTPGKHLPTLGRSAAGMTVEVTAGGQTWRAALKRNDLLVEPSPLPPIRVLRRTNLQRFIDSRPADRYNELRHLIGVERVEKAEDGLKRALDGVNAQLDEAVRVRVAAQDQLTRIWESEGMPGASWTAWAAAAAAQETTGLLIRARRLREIGAVIDAASRARDAWIEAEASLRRSTVAVAAVEAEVAGSPGLEAAAALRLADILRRVGAHLAAGGQDDRCPVCEQAIGADDLRTALDARLRDLGRFDELATRGRAAGETLGRGQTAVAAARAALVRAGASMAEVVGREPTGYDRLEYLIGGYDAPRGVEGSADADADAAWEAAAEVIAECAPIVATLREDEEATTLAAGRVNSIREMQARAAESAVTTLELQRTSEGLAAAHATVRATRIAYTQAILNEIATECNRLYATIHPNEEKAISTIAMDAKQRASLNQSVLFEGIDVPPQAYFSEAHLDTLGFCVWLAFAKRASGDVSNGGGAARETVLVLDDVFTSVDARHMNRLLALIVAEQEHFAQVIVTTHQLTWRDAFCTSHWPEKSMEMIELQSWSLELGMFSYQTPLAVDDLRAHVAARPFDRQAVAARAGMLLEATLDRLTFLYESSVPRNRENVYTLGQLMSATSKLFQKLQLTQSEREVAVRPVEILDRLRGQTVVVRNQVGAHYNVSGMDISDDEVREFGRLTVELVGALTCATCGQIPGTRTDDCIRCSCKPGVALRMTPMRLT